MIPDGRTGLYAIWRACERLGLRPPGVREDYLDNDVPTQADLLAYSQIRDHEEAKFEATLAGVKMR